MTDRDPTEETREIEWSLGVHTPNLGPHFPRLDASIRGRRVRNFGALAQEFASLEETTVAGAVERFIVEEDGRVADLVDQVVEEALRTSDRRKAKLLARVMQAVLSGDDAQIDIAGLVMPAVRAIESQHMPLIVRLASRPPAGASMRTQSGVVQQGPRTGAGAIAEALLTQLHALGLARDFSGGGQPSAIGDPDNGWYLAALGRAVFGFVQGIDLARPG